MTMTELDHDRIAAAVAEAETRTAGEIYCVLAPAVTSPRSDETRPRPARRLAR